MALIGPKYAHYFTAGFQQQCDGLIAGNWPGFDEAMQSAHWEVERGAEDLPLIPGTKLRMVAIEASPGRHIPAMRAFYTMEMVKGELMACFVWIELADSVGESDEPI